MMGLRLLLAVAYPVFAHLAGARSDGGWAALAMADIVLLLLLEPLLRRRAWALTLLALCLLWLWWVSQSRYALMPLLAPPVVFIALASWLFGRTLRAGQVPLITRIVQGLYTQASMPMTPALYRYTRQLTTAWAVMLGVLALANLWLALCAVPSGVLAQLGHRAAWTVTDGQWSLFANLLNYGIVGVFFLAEYWYRKLVFPLRPYRNVLQFMHQMAQLGPGFWNQLLR
ncbi:MAG: ketosynthase [Pseudoxanthomonas sp.]